MRPFEELREGFRHYLLSWKDENIKQYNKMFPDKGLHDLTHSDLFFLSGKAHGSDTVGLIKKMK